MTRIVVAFLLASAAACGAQQRPEDRGGPSCTDVGAHLLELASRDNEGEADEETSAGIPAEFERECRQDHWSRERRGCLLAAGTQEETLSCPEN
jgi:hypothetical protein